MTPALAANNPSLENVVRAILAGTAPPPEAAPTVTTLRLGLAMMADLQPLVGLIALRTLVLTRTRVADLTPLAGLTDLRELDLKLTRIADIAPLATLTRLRSLILSLPPWRISALCAA